MKIIKKLEEKSNKLINKVKGYAALIILLGGSLAIAIVYFAGVFIPSELGISGLISHKSDYSPIQSVKAQDGANLSIKEALWYELDKYGLTLDEKIEAILLIQCESGFNDYAIGVNKNGTKDLGLWQTNEYHQKISRDCAFNWRCQTEYVMNQIYLKQKNWSAWTCSHK